MKYLSKLKLTFFLILIVFCFSSCKTENDPYKILFENVNIFMSDIPISPQRELRFSMKESSEKMLEINYKEQKILLKNDTDNNVFSIPISELETPYTSFILEIYDEEGQQDFSIPFNAAIFFPGSILQLDHYSEDELKQIHFLSIHSEDLRIIRDIEKCTNLRKLHMTFTNVNDFSFLNKMKKLLILDISGNNISNLSPIKNLKNLYIINAGANNIEDLKYLRNKKQLIHLSLPSNKISDISALSDLTNLNYLGLYNNQVSDISPLSKLSNLDYLILTSNDIEDISVLSSLNKLEILSLSNNQISDLTAISDLSSLKELSIQNNPISDLSILENFPNIKVIK